ncbi:methylcrotonoyl-CoA carboxylase beta chain, mitochondrial [Phlyctema vagabunda]|uniref:Methylcrotonoyl-CoA carboxylase beta chain, mitochondrial n=1 Tax=Phlyctema vagabunda TaxID=108571 RepID=A0ABR4PHU4_9HELO
MTKSEKGGSKSSNERLTQVAKHLSPSSKPKGSVPPADYSDVLSQLQTLRNIASTPDLESRGYIRQKQAGKLWVRERVLALLDEGTFREIGSVSGSVTWKRVSSQKEEPVSFIPSNNVQGLGKLLGRKVVFTADDFSLRAGHADGALMEKTIYMEKLALSLKLPIVKLVDGSSGGGSVTTIRQNGYSYIPPMPSFEFVVKQLNDGIPNLGAVLGPAIGLGAARVVACHFSVMAEDIGALFNAGPKVVAGATFEEDLTFRELGGPNIHCTNGTIDNLAANEQECFQQLRTILSYLPNHGLNLPPSVESPDPASRRCESLRSIIPRRKARMYNARSIITTVLDAGSWFEIGRLWGTTAIVGVGRLSGRSIGIISLDCEVNAGALDAAGSQKVTRHLKFCDTFNLPVLQFVDVPGYAIGTVAERTATMRWGVQLATTYYATTVPVFSVVTRRVYGVAGGIMLDCRDPRMRVAWPSGEWGSLPLDGGIEVGHAAELKNAEKEGRRDERYKKLEDEYIRLMNPVRTANAFGVEEIIDPADTRAVVVEWCKHVYEELLPLRVQDRANGKIRPVFY